MTGDRIDTKTVKAFLLLLVFFAAVMLIFFYTARKEVGEQVRVMIPPASQKARVVTWEHLRELHDNAKVEISINNTRVIAEVMRSDAKRQQGLSGKEKLAENEGMLFIFDRQEPYSFWNKDMKIPIDVMWMARGEVMGISPLPVYNGQTPAIVTAPSSVDVVLEVSAGFANTHKIMVGNTIIVYEAQ